MKKEKMRTLILLTLLVATSGCQHMPDVPQGNLCSHNEPAFLWFCNDIRTGAARPNVPDSSTDKWVGFDPVTWQNIQDYIDALRRMMQNNGGGPIESKGVWLTSRDIEMFQNFLYTLQNKNKQNAASAYSN